MDIVKQLFSALLEALLHEFVNLLKAPDVLVSSPQSTVDRIGPPVSDADLIKRGDGV